MTTHQNYKTNQQNTKSKSLDPSLSASAYVINNSLYCALQPKRTSFDVKLYMQLHRKLMRKAVIQKKFQQSLYNFKNQIDYKKKGFKGKSKHQTILNRSVSERQKRVHTQGSVIPKNIANNQLFQEKPGESSVSFYRSAQNSHNKPNMMYNLSLYRKGFKKQQIKNERMCLNVIQTFNKVKQQKQRQMQENYTKRMNTMV